MYVPPSFAENDLTKLHDFIESYSFAILFSTGAEPTASHLPFLLDRGRGPQGTLIGHMARANPQWRDAGGGPALVVFSGPHAYVTPSWYGAEKVVPTWNYVAVHVYGTLRVVDELVAVRQIVQRTVDRYERSRPQPWSYPGPPEFLDQLAGAIVGFEIEIERLEGKWKLSQNHSLERRLRVIDGLQESPHPDAQAVANLMQATLAPDR